VIENARWRNGMNRRVLVLLVSLMVAFSGFGLAQGVRAGHGCGEWGANPGKAFQTVRDMFGLNPAGAAEYYGITVGQNILFTCGQ
jgi:hypothetical protein